MVASVWLNRGNCDSEAVAVAAKAVAEYSWVPAEGVPMSDSGTVRVMTPVLASKPPEMVRAPPSVRY